MFWFLANKKRLAYIDLTPLLHKKRMEGSKYIIHFQEVAKRQKRIYLGVFFALLLIASCIASTKIAIHFYRENLQKEGLITEKDLRIAMLVENREHDPVDLVFLAKTINNILATSSGKQRSFLEKALPEAIRIQNNYKVPASAILSQAIYESGYGDSDLAKQANNFFGLKALGNKWKGEVVIMSTWDDNRTNYHKQPFRKFPSIYEGFHGYVDFISQPRYKKAWDNTEDGLDFVNALLRAGYCPDSVYLRDIKKIMERHKFSQLDEALKKTSIKIIKK